MITEIPLSERNQRIKKIQEKLKERDLDAYLVHSTESDFASVLYLSNHWPVWETCGIIVPKEGNPILLIGAEAQPYAESRSTIKETTIKAILPAVLTPLLFALKLRYKRPIKPMPPIVPKVAALAPTRYMLKADEAAITKATTFKYLFFSLKNKCKAKKTFNKRYVPKNELLPKAEPPRV